jgi:hypothetical protein
MGGSWWWQRAVLPDFVVLQDDFGVFGLLLAPVGCHLRLWNATSGILKSTFKGYTGLVQSYRFFLMGRPP